MLDLDPSSSVGIRTNTLRFIRLMASYFIMSPAMNADEVEKVIARSDKMNEEVSEDIQTMFQNPGKCPGIFTKSGNVFQQDSAWPRISRRTSGSPRSGREPIDNPKCEIDYPLEGWVARRICDQTSQAVPTIRPPVNSAIQTALKATPN